MYKAITKKVYDKSSCTRLVLKGYYAHMLCLLRCMQYVSEQTYWAPGIVVLFIGFSFYAQQ